MGCYALFVARFALFAALAIVVASHPSRTHFYSEVSDTSLSRAPGVFRVVSEDSCTCRWVFLPCQIEVRQETMKTIVSEASKCPLLSRYCCDRATLINLPDLKAKVSANANEPTTDDVSPLALETTNTPTTQNEEVTDTTLGQRVIAEDDTTTATLSSSLSTTTAAAVAATATTKTETTTSPLDDCADSQNCSGVSDDISTPIATVSGTEPLLNTSQRTRTVISSPSAMKTNTPLGLKPNPQSKKEITDIKACSCMTKDECQATWSVFKDLPKYRFKTSLRCKGANEVICCFGKVIPPRMNKSNVPTGLRGSSKTPSAAEKEDAALWTALQGLIAGWFQNSSD